MKIRKSKQTKRFKKTRKFKKTGRSNKNKILKGGHNAAKVYNGARITPADVERLFNPDLGLLWKIPVQFVVDNGAGYGYAAYNQNPVPQYEILFDSLPAQVYGDVYVPIYKYVEANLPQENTSHASDAMDVETGLESIMPMYDYAKNLLAKDGVWDVCIGKGKMCPFSPDLLSRVSRSCCGFIAPALGVVLHYADINNSTILNNIFNRNLAITMGLNFYSKYTGYGKSDESWNVNCNRWSNIIAEGTNIMTFYGRDRSNDLTKCATYHHFIIYRRGEYCIIIDAWSGGGGQRGEWIRIMKYEHINQILININTTTSYEKTNVLLNAYFIVPHSISVNNNIDENLQSKLLGVGAYNLREWNHAIDTAYTEALANRVIKNGGKIKNF
jgi:hypothetical protein